MADPKKGTGKKPKGSGRRLYTDENPKDTVGIKFATPADARATVAKVKKVNKPFARKIQILTVVEQRSRFGGKPQQAAIAKAGKAAIRKQHGKSPIKKAYRGVLKARVNKLYGGDVTCGKVNKLKSRPNATPRDKQLANWFINMQNCRRK
jgi:hypothetical protein|tara:strand:+ start:180 stop:629 length:450 start_codon:yes stop_codon:yes gene_type:complete